MPYSGCFTLSCNNLERDLDFRKHLNYTVSSKYIVLITTLSFGQICKFTVL